VIVVYSVDNITSFEHVREWMHDVNQYEGISVKLLVGNKCDLVAPERKVSAEQGKVFHCRFALVIL
jgi:Ras-related protein Rab-1A